MGMDVCGRRPTTPEGEYFCNNAWWWQPLADYVCLVAPKIAAGCKHWQSNDGDGLDATASQELAAVLEREIESGRTERYARLRKSQIEAMPNEPCEICDATGTRKTPPEGGAGDPRNGGIKCNGCNGTGYRRPWASCYSFEVENVRHFAVFLRGCGGFQIY